MSLKDLHSVFVSTQNACNSINACGNLSLPKEFKDSYASLIRNDPSFSRHNEAVWLANDILELHSRGNRTVTYIPSVFFFVAQKLVPLYLELQAYRASLVLVLQQYNHTLDDTEEPNCVQYINNVTFLSDEEKHWLCKFVTDGSWWGKGRQIKRAQDFYESPLMQSASLTQETQSEVARITKQFAENPMLASKLTVTKNGFAEESSNADRLAIALNLFKKNREEKATSGWASFDAWAKEARAKFAVADAGMFVAAGFDYAGFMRKFVYNPTVANSYFKDHTDADKNEVGNFISQNRTSPRAASWYIDKANLPRVKGLGPGVALNFMMKVRPAEFATYSPMIDKALMSVGLLAKPLPTEPTVESYEQSKSLQGQVLAKMHELKIGKAADDDSAADYLTVNEFAWWLSDEKSKNLVKEKVMCAQLKPVNSKDSLKTGSKKLDDAFAGDALLKRLAAALRTKPFAILAGHSGTGKSQLVRRLAYMTCNNQKLIDEGKGKTAPGNYCMVQVKPNWHDSTDLLGYYSDLGTRHFVNTAFVQFLCKAYAYPETPFFLCLDEMNLAPVEQYFAEYLSAVESLEKKGNDWVSDSLIEIVKTGEKDENGNAKVDEQILGQIMGGAQSTEAADWIRKHGLTIPKNLFVVGTVNMDETTCQFSRKVLDRAMTLLMNEVKFAEMGKSVDPSKEELLDEAGIAFFMHGGRRGHVGTAEADLLDKLNEPLENTPFVVAYRFANEYALYEEALANLGGVEPLADGETEQAKIDDYWKKVSECAADALDQVVLMKLLPRIHGMKEVVKGIFEGRKVEGKDIPGLKEEVKPDGLSCGMMTSILNRGDEYLTFWP